jgi:hypothetical protein
MSSPTVHQRVTRTILFRPERAILATLLAAVVVGQGVRSVLPVRQGPAPAAASPAAPRLPLDPHRRDNPHPPRDPADPN